MKKYDYVVSALLLAFSAWIFHATKDFPKYYGGAPGSGFWPRIIAGILIVLSIVLVAENLIKLKKKTDADSDNNSGQALHKKRVYLMFAAMLLLALSLEYLGFIISSLWFVPAVMLIMEEKRWYVLLTSSAAITAAIYLIFTYALKMALPKAFFM